MTVSHAHATLADMNEAVTYSDNDTLLALVESFAGARILVVGDVMLDQFVYGRAERVSPEAPIPVLSIDKETTVLGGAGNVVRNIAALGAQAGLVSLLGEDETADDIRSLSDVEQSVLAHFVAEKKRRSTLKVRYIAGAQQLLRADHEDPRMLSEESEHAMMAYVQSVLQDYQLLVLSDYAKGCLSPRLVKALIDAANHAGIPVFVDPKQWDISVYGGASLLSPNEKEAEAFHHGPFSSEEEMVYVVSRWCQLHAIGHILVTRGAKGMMLINENGIVCQLRAHNREVYDVSGAGDTVLATLSAATCMGASLPDAVMVANHAAAIAVSRTGTATVHRTDLKTAIHTADVTTGHNKILSQDAARQMVAYWQQRGLSVGFTNGCFDIVHAGHISSLSACKRECDRLILAINSDASVKRLKGDSRPVNAELDRAMLLAALSDVDAVVIFREDTPEPLLELLRPDVLMKGEDYEKEQIVGWEFVESYGGKVVRIPLVQGYSTTGTIAKITTQAS